MAADSITAKKETTKAETKIVRSPSYISPVSGERREGGVKITKAASTVGRIETRSIQFYVLFAESRLFLLVQPIDIAALIQHANKRQIDELLWLGRLPLGFSSQNSF